MKTFIFHRKEDLDNFLKHNRVSYREHDKKYYVLHDNAQLIRFYKGEELSNYLLNQEFIKREKLLRKSLLCKKTRK